MNELHKFDLKTRAWNLSKQILLPVHEGDQSGFYLAGDSEKKALAAIFKAAELGRNVFIYGNSGTGKSTIVQILHNALPPEERPVIWNVSKLQMEIKSNRNPEHHLATFLAAHARKWLILDDMGAEPDWKQYGVGINFAYEVLENRRLRSVPTWIISNSDPVALAEKYEGEPSRVAERLKQYAPILCAYESLTLKRKLKPRPWPVVQWPKPVDNAVPCPEPIKAEITDKLRKVAARVETFPDRPGLGEQLKIGLGFE